MEADFAICTIPAPVLKDIPNDFSPETQAAIKSTAFVPAVKIGFQTRRRFWEEDHAIYGGHLLDQPGHHANLVSGERVPP